MSNRTEFFVCQVFSRSDMTSDGARGLRDDAKNVKRHSKDHRGAIVRSDNAERVLRFIAEYDGGSDLPPAVVPLFKLVRS